MSVNNLEELIGRVMGNELERVRVVKNRNLAKARKAKKPIRRKTAKQKLAQEVDLLLKEFIHRRDGFRCVKCGASGVIQSAHILSKGVYKRLRFEPLNLLTLCVSCHIFGAHKNPADFMDWLNEKYPMRVDQLRVLAATAKKPDMKELRIGWKLELQQADPPPQKG